MMVGRRFFAALLGLRSMAMYGKRGSGGSAAVLDAPEPGLAPETTWPIPEPAPAGTLQRRRAQGGDESAFGSASDEEGAYRPRRASTAHLVRTAVFRTVAGRIVGGCCVAAVLGAVGLGAIAARRSLLHDPRFAIASSSDIEITGNKHLTRAQVLSVFGADLERNIFRIPMAQRRDDLERLPWVQHAEVMRLLPNALRIAITERTPVAYVRQGSHIGLVDASGVLLDMPEDVAGDPHYSFPVLTGLSESDPLTVREARMEVYHRFMQDLDSGGAKNTDSLSEVDVSNPEDVKAVVTESGSDVLVHFGDEKFLQRFKTFSQNLAQWKSQYPKLAAVDARYDSEFVLEMQRGAEVPLAGDAAAKAAIDIPAVPRTAKKPSAVAKKPTAPVVKHPAVAVKVKARPVAAGKKPILVHAWKPGDSGQVTR